MLNFTGTEKAGEVFRMAARHSAAVIICYVQGRHVRAVGDFAFSADPAAAMRGYFSRLTELAAKNGLEKIVLDPGLGFYYRNLQDGAARVRHQMSVFLNTFRLRALGFPVCHALPHAFEYFGEEVRSAEPFFAVLAALGKTDLFRTHEVPRVKAVLDTLKVFQQDHKGRALRARRGGSGVPALLPARPKVTGWFTPADIERRPLPRRGRPIARAPRVGEAGARRGFGPACSGRKKTGGFYPRRQIQSARHER